MYNQIKISWIITEIWCNSSTALWTFSKKYEYLEIVISKHAKKFVIEKLDFFQWKRKSEMWVPSSVKLWTSCARNPARKSVWLVWNWPNSATPRKVCLLHLAWRGNLANASRTNWTRLLESGADCSWGRWFASFSFPNPSAVSKLILHCKYVY